MRIGFDAKRIFQNNTGLGNYSRSLVATLAKEFSQHKYHLFAPRQTALFNSSAFDNVRIVSPTTGFYKSFPSIWRRKGMVKDIARQNIDVFHGLSNELPAGIQHSGSKSVITVHDLIFERYPETYHFDQRFSHRWKMKQSCIAADAVIAASNQTKQDLVDFYKIPPQKIAVCYQNCSPLFERRWGEIEKETIKQRYGLPEQFFLFVSSITKRKNLLAICKAMHLLKDKLQIPLVIIGDGKKEKEEVKRYLQAAGLINKVVFLNELPQANEEGFTSSADFPGIYQSALALIYPSIFEGFGIPLLEAFWSGTPVISSNTSSLPEVAADAALTFSPDDIETLSENMFRIATDSELRNDLKEKGLKRALHFTAEKHARAVMKVYLSVI